MGFIRARGPVTSLMLLLGAVGLSPAATPGRAAAFVLAGAWDATLSIGGREVPFPLRIAGSVQHPTGWFLNGPVRIVATDGRFSEGHLVLDFAQYAKRLDLRVLEDGRLEGTYGPITSAMQGVIPTLEVSASRAPPHPRAARGAVPALAGVWIVPIPTDEKAWKLLVRQRGAALSAVLLRVDGDSGELRGTWSDGQATLSHFDGARPALVELTTQDGHLLSLVLHDLHGGADTTLSAYPAAESRARGLPEADDPRQHTTVRDPKEPFVFRFPDLAGRTVTSADARFARKVLIVDVSGSWCPNCHDEAPFLEELYRRYRARGLEVVSVSFEEPEQLETLARLRAFIQRYGLTYTVLVGGTRAEARGRLPQVEHLDYWPTTFFIGRDGRVRAVHTGFAAPVTGQFHEAVRREFESEVETLLAE